MAEDPKNFKMTPANSTKQIREFVDYIKAQPNNKPLMVKEMTIISDDMEAFSTDMEVATLNPFKRNPESSIDLNKFVDKYQQLNDRIHITFNKPLALTKDLLWIMTVPPQVKMQVILRF